MCKHKANNKLTNQQIQISPKHDTIFETMFLYLCVNKQNYSEVLYVLKNILNIESTFYT